MKNLERASFFDKIAASIFIVVVSLLPLFFIPFYASSIESVKAYYVTIGVSLVAIFWVLARLSDKKIAIPKHRALVCVLSIVLWITLESFRAHSFSLAFLGRDFGIGTGVNMLVTVASFYFALIYLPSKKRITELAVLTGGATVLALIIQVLFYFFPRIFSFAALTSVNTTLIGNWNDTGVFVGFTAIVSFLAIDILTLRKWMKAFTYSILILSLMFLFFVNFAWVTYTLGVVSLIFFIITLTKSNEIDTRKEKLFPVASFAVLLVTLFLIFAQPVVRTALSRFHVSYTEVKPTLVTTYNVFKHLSIRDIAFGSGPNTFANKWMLHRPLIVNQTNFSDVTFSSGYSTLTTTFVTLGVVGGLLFLLLMFVYIRTVFTYKARPYHDALGRFLHLSALMGSLFLWFFVIIHNPGQVVWIFTFITTGIFLGLLAVEGSIAIQFISFENTTKHIARTGITLITLVMLGSVALFLVSIKKLVALGIAEQASRSAMLNPARADSIIHKALALDPQDTYQRVLASINLLELQQIAQNPPKISDDTIRAQFQQLFTSALDASNSAIAYDVQSIDNHIGLAQVYRTVVPLNIPGAYEKAEAAYRKAQELFPNNSGLFLAQAGLALEGGFSDKALSLIDEALKIKPNNSDAYLLLAQIELNAHNIPSAEAALVKGLSYDQANLKLLFNYGVLEYSNKKYDTAESILEKAVIGTPQSVESRYYLGLTYAALGKKDLAITQFSILQKMYPNNESIKRIISNIQIGSDALQGLVEGAPQTTESTPSTNTKTIPSKIKSDTTSKKIK